VDSNKGHIAHIKQKSGSWAYEFREQNISESMSLTTLLKIHDVSAGAITAKQLDAAARKAGITPGAPIGECLEWVKRAVQMLHSEGRVEVTSVDKLAEEFSNFASGNRAYAKRNTFPNVKASQYCA
jgi:hypothetical protein